MSHYDRMMSIIEDAKSRGKILMFDDFVTLEDKFKEWYEKQKGIDMDAGTPTGAGLGSEVQAHTPLSHASEQLINEIYALRDRIIGLGNRIEPYLRQADGKNPLPPIEEPDQLENSSVFVGSVYSLAHEVRGTQSLVDGLIDRLEV